MSKTSPEARKQESHHVQQQQQTKSSSGSMSTQEEPIVTKKFYSSSSNQQSSNESKAAALHAKRESQSAQQQKQAAAKSSLSTWQANLATQLALPDDFTPELISQLASEGYDVISATSRKPRSRVIQQQVLFQNITIFSNIY